MSEDHQYYWVTQVSTLCPTVVVKAKICKGRKRKGKQNLVCVAWVIYQSLSSASETQTYFSFLFPIPRVSLDDIEYLFFRAFGKKTFSAAVTEWTFIISEELVRYVSSSSFFARKTLCKQDTITTGWNEQTWLCKAIRRSLGSCSPYWGKAIISTNSSVVCCRPQIFIALLSTTFCRPSPPSIVLCVHFFFAHDVVGVDTDLQQWGGKRR